MRPPGNPLSLLIAGLLLAGEAIPVAPRDLGPAVVQFAREQLGRRVGDGQCTGLIAAALAAAGARDRTEASGPDQLPAWGTLVPTPAQARPGDILRFQDVVFAGRSRGLRNGRPHLSTWKTTYPDHAAIIEEVRENGRVLVLLHQNVGPVAAPPEVRLTVQRTVLRLRDRRPGGTLQIERPVPALNPRIRNS